MASFTKFATLAASCLLLATGASGYYHFVHYNTRTGPFVPIYEKFDLNNLPGKTVFFYFSEQQAPVQLAGGDSMSAVNSEIRAAVKVWNDVESSDLRVAFGGTTLAGLPQSAPGIDVVFDEMPPGLIALGGPTKRGDFAGFGTGSFVPIMRSVVKFNQDMTQRPSYSDAFFMTAVHEFGHALGLQHALTSSTMSTEITRSTSKARPLAADDIAGISVLYPTAAFRSATGAIAGRVASAGVGVGLASVVAIAANGSAVSAMTAPDGTYRIEGIPAGNYYVYAHSLPPALSAELTPANIIAPLDPDGRSLPFPAAFDLQFYPGTHDWQLAPPLPVNAGQSLENVNFNVQASTRPATLHSVQAYAYPGNYGVKPAYISFSAGRQLIAAAGAGLIVNGGPAPGLSVSVLGGLASVIPNSPRAYTADYILIDFQQQTPAPADGPRHLIFTLNNEVYVLPYGFRAVQRTPPSISSLTQTVDGFGRNVAQISGTELNADSRFWFDGVQAQVLDSNPPGITVLVPVAPVGHKATITILNSDGQTSMFLQAQNPATYQYDGLGAADTAATSMTPSSVAAASESMIEITGTGTAFVDGLTTVGFGSSDVVVKHAWVLSPTRIVANVNVNANAASAFYTLTVTTGLRTLNQQFALQVLPPDQKRFSLSSTIVNQNQQSSSVYAGSSVSMQAPNLTQSQISAGLVLSVGGVQIPNFTAVPGQLFFVMPTLQPGPAIIRLQAGPDSAAIVAVVDGAAGSIVSVTVANFPVDANRGIRSGDQVTLLVSGYGDLGALIAPSRVVVSVGGVEQRITQITQVGGATPFQLIQFTVAGQIPIGNQLVMVSVDGKSSSPFAVTVR